MAAKVERVENSNIIPTIGIHPGLPVGGVVCCRTTPVSLPLVHFGIDHHLQLSPRMIITCANISTHLRPPVNNSYRMRTLHAEVPRPLIK